MNINSSDIIIDPRTLGSSLLLVGISEWREYKDGKRTDTIVGYTYNLVLPDKKFAPFNVKIKGKQLLDVPTDFVEVTFQDLELFVYSMNGKINLAARATGISLVNSTK